MSLQFIFGNSGSGKSHLLYQKIIEESIRHPQQKFLVIVPEQFTMQTQRDLVLMHPDGGIMNIDVLSFQRLATRVFREVGSRNRTVLSETGKNLMLRRVAQQQKEALHLFGAQINRIGFISEIKSVLSELMQYETTDEDLEEMLLIAKDRPLLRAKLEDIRVLYRSFLQYREDQFVKPEEMMDLLSDAAPHSDLLRDSVLAFDGFAGFTPSQFSVFRELTALCSRVYLTVTIDAREDFFGSFQEQDLFAPSRRLIRGVADAAQGSIEEPIVLGKEKLPRFSEHGALRHLEQNLFRRNEQVYTGDSDEISLHALGTPLQEIHFAARSISGLVRREGYRYREIAVIAGNLGAYESYIRRIFPLYGIPFFLDETRGALLNPCLEFLRGALSLLLEDFSRESVFRFLRTGMAGLSFEETDRLENHVLASGIRGRRRWETSWDRPAPGETEEDLAAMNALRARFMDLAGPFADQMSGSGRALRVYASALVGLMEDCALQQKLKDREQILREAGQREEASEYAQIYAIVIDLLDEMVDLLGEEEMDCREFSEILDAGLEEAKIGMIPPGIDQVQVGDIRRSRISGIRVLFFVGLNDGWVPASAKEGGILSDTERELLLDHGAVLAPSERENSYIQRFYLYQNLTKPSEKLCLSWCASGGDGTAMRPSYLVSVLSRLFPNSPLIREADTGTRLDQVASKETGMLYLLHGLQKIRESEDGWKTGQTGGEEEDWMELYRFYQNDEDYRSCVRELTGAAFVDVIESLQQLDPETARALYGLSGGGEGAGEMRASVTRLECFAGCPFSHFASYGLRLGERPEYGVKTTDLGTMFHEAMARFSEELMQEGLDLGSVSYEAAAARMDRCVEQVAAAYGGGILFDGARKAYTVRRLRRILRRTLQAMRIQTRAGAFRLSGVEVSFTEKTPLSGSHPETESAALSLQGRIDRIDTVETKESVYVKVIDYKSGAAKFDFLSLYYGTQIQLMVYLKAAMQIEKQRHPGKKVIPAGALYLRMQDPVLKKETDPGQAVEDLLKEMRPNGPINREESILRLYDREWEGDSLVIPAGRKKDGTVKASGLLVTTEELTALLDCVSDELEDMGDAILGGSIGARPFRDARGCACDYCIYADLCGRDSKIPGRCQARTPGKTAAEIREIFSKGGKGETGDAGKLDKGAAAGH